MIRRLERKKKPPRELRIWRPLNTRTTMNKAKSEFPSAVRRLPVVPTAEEICEAKGIGTLASPTVSVVGILVDRLVMAVNRHVSQGNAYLALLG